MKKVEESAHASSTEVGANLTMADFTRVLVTNVVLSTTVVVLVFHAPVAWAGFGAVLAGLVIWVGTRFVHARRAR